MICLACECELDDVDYDRCPNCEELARVEAALEDRLNTRNVEDAEAVRRDTLHGLLLAGIATVLGQEPAVIVKAELISDGKSKIVGCRVDFETGHAVDTLDGTTKIERPTDDTK